MSHSKILLEERQKVKRDIKTKWLAGEGVRTIANSFGTSERNIYYHLNPITPEEKAIHARNVALRSIAAKKENERRGNEQTKASANVSTESDGKASNSSLSDFIEQ